MYKTILSAILAMTIIVCFGITEPTSYGTHSSGDNNGASTINEMIKLDVDDALKNGVYSEDGKYVFYDNSMFIVADLTRAQVELKNKSISNGVQDPIASSRGRIAYDYKSYGIFYSRGSQHVLGRITLQPEQKGSFLYGNSLEISSSVTGGVNEGLFQAKVEAGYTQSYTISIPVKVENSETYRQTVVLSSVFMVHDYDVFDRGFMGYEYNYQGTGKVYEPYSHYTHWVQNG